ncbi:recombinase family protein [Clostridium sulfidigenes]|uniref:recombinase family protein n=1 Tax=Clostridium sulfidigenes TaxID=318464 RepID=UPI003F8A38C5
MKSNIAIYSRKSKFTGKGESIENQIIKCKKFIEFKFNIDPENAEIYIDEDYTGRNENRPKFKEMKKKIESGDINHIVIYQLNRFGRNARDIHNSMAMCEEHNCVMYSATEGFDTSTSFGRAVMGILASLAQLETEQLGERIKDNMYTLAKMGRWLGGQAPLGFDGTREYYIDDYGKERSVTKLKENKEELKLVKDIYNKYLEKKSLSQVGKWSLTHNFKGKNGGDLDKSAINAILQNPVYVKSNDNVMQYLTNKNYEVCGNPNGNGLLRYGSKDDVIVAVSSHKGVISPADWLQVQNILKSNKSKAPRLGKTNTALLTGILRCSCGSTMRVTYGHVKKDGVRPFYYTCTMKNNSGGTRCTSKNINGILLEEKLIKYLKNYNLDILIKELEVSLNETSKNNFQFTSESIDGEIEKSSKSISKLLNKLKLIDDEEVSKIVLSEISKEKNNIKELTSKKETLLNSQAELSSAQADIYSIVNNLYSFNTSFELLTIEQRQNKLKSILESIVYTNGKFELTFNKKKLDNANDTLSSIISKNNLSQFRVSSFRMSYKKSTFFSSAE